MIENSAEEKKSATLIDHHYLNFWLWACLHDANAYLVAFRNLNRAMSASVAPSERASELRAALQEVELARYHFVTAMGTLLRVLKRVQHLFPSIQPAYSRAKHLLAEGKDIRDMIEHAPDDYELGRGKKADQFVRVSEDIATTLPGDQPGSASATGTLVDEKGHWIGGRLCVEIVIAELRPIAEEAARIPPPPQDINQ